MAAKTDLSSPLLALDASEPRVVWEGFFVVLPVYSSYASLCGLQHVVKESLDISDGESQASNAFGLTVALLYACNLSARLLHQVVLSSLTIRCRVLLAMLLMMVSMLVLAIPVMMCGSKSLWWAVLAYTLGGLSIGAFDPNFLSSITPLGHRTKQVAISAIPVGMSALLICSFFSLGPPLSVPPAFVYGVLALGLMIGMFIFSVRVPDAPVSVDSHAVGLHKLAYDLRSFRDWLPGVWSPTFAFSLDMFAIAAFSPGIALYIYTMPTLQVLPGLEMPTNSFFAVFSVFSMLGSITGRNLSYRVDPRHPAVYLLLTCCGVCMLLGAIPLLALASTFLIYLGDGFIYGSISRHIDSAVSGQFNLSAITVWCILGDIGAVLGALSVNRISDWIVD
mmetsp:Transcript_20045/g.36206  ORF Transcript_20045/g.36206 Transcript_20045/m.36206 type:complete len:392 (-) Transcript_20045:77-1252(-)